MPMKRGRINNKTISATDNTEKMDFHCVYYYLHVAGKHKQKEKKIWIVCREASF